MCVCVCLFDQDELAEQTLKAMCRKFSESAKVWLRHIAWLLTKDRAEAARKVLDKSFAALPKRKHIKVGPYSWASSASGTTKALTPLHCCSRLHATP